MSEFDLNSYLSSYESDGVVMDGGGFTISHEKARRKMSQYSLPRTHAWILKMIQAGVGFGCVGIGMTQTRNDSTIYFAFEKSRDLPTIPDLVNSILTADIQSTEPLGRLAVALRVIVEGAGLSFLLEIAYDENDRQAIYSGVYFGEMTEDKRTKERENWKVGLTLKIHHLAHTDVDRNVLRVIPLRDHGLPIMLELERYAYVSPVPIVVDGRRIDGILRSGALSWTFTRRPLRMCGLEIPGDDDPSFPIAQDMGNRIFKLSEPLEENITKVLYSQVSEAYFLLAIEGRLNPNLVVKSGNKSYIHWVDNGVVTESERLPLTTSNLSLHVYVSADGCRTDLTGFHLTDSSLKRERKDRVLLRMAEVLTLEVRAGRDILGPLADPANERANDELKKLHEGPVLQLFTRYTKRVVKKALTAYDNYKNPVVDWRASNAQKRYERELKSLVKQLEVWSLSSSESADIELADIKLDGEVE